MDLEVLNRALAAHSQWKLKLTNGIAGGGKDLDPSQIGLDNQCEFGKWLGAHQPEARHRDAYSRVKMLHAQFHRVAGKVAQLAKEGKRAEAEQMMRLGGQYTDASAQLVTALTAWKKAA